MRLEAMRTLVEALAAVVGVHRTLAVRADEGQEMATGVGRRYGGGVFCGHFWAPFDGRSDAIPGGAWPCGSTSPAGPTRPLGAASLRHRLYCCRKLLQSSAWLRVGPRSSAVTSPLC